LTTVAKIAFIL